jgi:putative ABC transport system permease protein
MKFKYALRSMRKHPLVTAMAIVSLALGIGANSAVFSAIDAILLKPLPFPESDQLMLVQQSNPRNPGTIVAPVRLRDWDRLNTTFQAISGYYTQDGSELYRRRDARIVPLSRPRSRCLDTGLHERTLCSESP